MRAPTGNGVELVDLSWKAMGSCRALDPELFFPASDADAGPALAVCRTCPVLHPCLEFALDRREYEGIWGGTTGHERRAIVRRRRTAVSA